MTQMRTILLVILVQVATIAACRELRAEAPADSIGASQQPARPTIQKPLTREDADLMLREAHSAIEQGRYADAEKIISRVENAHVQFPFIHVGPTPASLRKELAHAERLRAASKSMSHDQPAGASKYLPFSRSGNNQTNDATDPFASRGKNIGPISAPSTAASQTMPPAAADHRLDGMSAPGTPSDSQATRPRSAGNPFTSAGQPAGLSSLAKTTSEPPSATDALSYPAMPALDGNPQDLPLPTTRSQAAPTAHGAADSNPSWQLPSAPLPRGESDQQFDKAGSSLMPPNRTATNPSTNNSRSPVAASKQKAQEHLSAVRKALATGDIDLAEKLTQAANSLGVPESQYLPDEDRPSLVAWDIARAKQKEGHPQSSKENHQQPGIARLPAPAPAPTSRYDSQPAKPTDLATNVQDRHADATPTAYRDQERDSVAPPITPIPQEPAVRTTPAAQAALPRNRGSDGPLVLAARPSPAGRLVNSEAAPPSDDLPLPPAANAEVVSDAGELPKPEPPVAAPIEPAIPIATENAAPAKPQGAAGQPHKSLIDSAAEAQQIVLRKVDAEVLKRQSEAVRLREKDSERALATLREAQQLVNDSKLPESTKRELLARIDKTLHDTQEYVKAHGAQIDLDKRNEAVLAGVDHDRDMKVKLQQKIAELVEEFNRLNHEQRYAEAEIIARRLNELAPNDPVAAQVWQNAKFIRRERMNQQLVDNKEDSVWKQLNAVEESAINPVAVDGQEMVYDQKHWKDFIPKRKGNKERTQRHTERELEIERRLQTPVLLKYQETPLTEVMNGLSELTGVNIHLDPRGLSQEGVNTDTPVTINLSKEISLKSALNLILEPLHLSYVINDEVLKITSEQLRDGEIYPQTYNVADLVTPIPNFVPSSNIGLQGLINDSMAAAGAGRGSYRSGQQRPCGSGQRPPAKAGRRPQRQSFGAAAQLDFVEWRSGEQRSHRRRPRRHGRRCKCRLRFAHRPDRFHRFDRHMGRKRRRPGRNPSLPHELEPRHQPNSGRARRNCRSALSNFAVCKICRSRSKSASSGSTTTSSSGSASISTCRSKITAWTPRIPEQSVPAVNRRHASNTVGVTNANLPVNFPNFTSDLDIPFPQDSFNLDTNRCRIRWPARRRCELWLRHPQRYRGVTS